jgi:hypothetical protein
MGNVVAALAEYFLTKTWGKRGVSTMVASSRHTKPDGTYDWDRAVTAALNERGTRVELAHLDVDRLHAFLRKKYNPRKKEAREQWEARWMEKWEDRFGKLSPADVPYYMGKRGKYKFDIFLDELTFGATNQPFGNSHTPTVLEHAMKEDLPSVPLLVKYWD